MNRQTLFIAGGALLVAALIGFAVGRQSGAGPVAVAPEATHDHPGEPEVWTCSMHPQIQQPDPGDCPICGMDLIPLPSRGSADLGPRVLEMSPSAVALANIQTTPVQQRYPEATVSVVGQLAHDETRLRTLSARFPARIDDLFINYTGIRVGRGEHLAMVYSPELLTAQRELLTAWRANPDSIATTAARERLRQWDLLPEQIDAIVASGEPSDHFELKTPIGGTVIKRYVNEGDYVQTGEPLFEIADLDHLWLKLAAFESDLHALRYGQQVSFTVEAYPGERFEGIVSFIAPEVERATRTVPVRVNVPNAEGRLRPGMLARARIVTPISAEGTTFAPEMAGKWISPMHPEVVKEGPGQCDVCGMDLVPVESLGQVQPPDSEPPVVVPASAVLRTGQRAVVYVKQADAEVPTFEGREVELGPRAGDVFIVKEGLEVGESVVTHGAFKIDSALQIQARPSMMNPEEAQPGTGPVATAQLTLPPALASDILPAYFKLQAALAADDGDAAKTALRDMMGIAGHQGPLPDLIHRMLAAQDLEGIRRPHFETLSMALISAMRQAPEAFEQTAWLMHCPMVYPDRGADWLQPDDALLNPYFGDMMLRCGEVLGPVGTVNVESP